MIGPDVKCLNILKHDFLFSMNLFPNDWVDLLAELALIKRISEPPLSYID
jgi:hypothetical protein